VVLREDLEAASSNSLKGDAGLCGGKASIRTRKGGELS
jgi:hypothetical protein